MLGYFGKNKWLQASKYSQINTNVVYVIHDDTSLYPVERNIDCHPIKYVERLSLLRSRSYVQDKKNAAQNFMIPQKRS